MATCLKLMRIYQSSPKTQQKSVIFSNSFTRYSDFGRTPRSSNISRDGKRSKSRRQSIILWGPKLKYVHSVEEAQTLAETALAHMIRNKIAATPDHFEIWFAYAAGTNSDLTKSVEEVIAKGEGFTAGDTERLTEQFSTDAKLARAMEEMGQEMDATMNRVAKDLKDAGQNTSDYGDALSDASGKMTKASDPKAMQAMIDELVAATENMESHSRVLETRLQESTAEVDKLRTNMEAVRTESLTDKLTGLPNRRAFDESLRFAQDDAVDTKQPMSLLIGDIDKFKLFNDTYGHQTGDQVLKLVSHCLKQTVKGKDTAARYGGEEFAVILPGTSLQQALLVAEQIRMLVESKKVVKRSTGESLGTITLSLGAAELKPGEDVTQLIERADTCLYAAKNAGRNRVCGENELPESNAA